MKTECSIRATGPNVDEIQSIKLRDKVGASKLQLGKCADTYGVASYRSNLLDMLTTAEDKKDRAAIALIRFFLAYSYDHCKTNRFNLAVENLSMAIGHYPDWLIARFNLAVALIHIGHYEESVGEFDFVELDLIALLDSCEKFCKDSSQPCGRSEMLLVMGKLLLFRAEARSRLGDSNSLSIARFEVLRAESYLLVSNETEAWQWLKQIGHRLTNIVGANSRPSIFVIYNRFPVIFFIGSLIGFVVLALLCNVAIGTGM